jgi:hypothetical protein
VARLGDGWIGSALSPDGAAAFLEILDVELADHGRKLSDIDLKMTHPLSEGVDKSDWEADANYIEAMADLGFSEVICSHRGGTDDYLGVLTEFASTIGL